jgi:hypothetical protein
MTCAKDDKDVFDCKREIPKKKLDHSGDALIECVADNNDIKPDPDENSVRIVKYLPYDTTDIPDNPEGRV